MNITIFYDKIIVLCRIFPKKKVYNIYFRGIFDSGKTENNLESVTVAEMFIYSAIFVRGVRVNTKIIDNDDNWNLLLCKEAYHIKCSAPSLNNGLKAGRELCLFS